MLTLLRDGDGNIMFTRLVVLLVRLTVVRRLLVTMADLLIRDHTVTDSFDAPIIIHFVPEGVCGIDRMLARGPAHPVSRRAGIPLRITLVSHPRLDTDFNKLRATMH